MFSLPSLKGLAKSQHLCFEGLICLSFALGEKKKGSLEVSYWDNLCRIKFINLKIQFDEHWQNMQCVTTTTIVMQNISSIPKVLGCVFAASPLLPPGSLASPGWPFVIVLLCAAFHINTLSSISLGLTAFPRPHASETHPCFCMYQFFLSIAHGYSLV